MNRNVTCCAWLLALLLGSSTLAQTPPQKRRRQHAVKQQEVVPPEPVYQYPSPSSSEEPLNSLTHVYTYVEQMPTLNGKNAMTASAAAIKQYLSVPSPPLEGRVFVYFEVDKTGAVSHPRIAKGLRADVDSAVVAAVRQLPRFSPGKLAGYAVTVSFIVPVTISVTKKP